MEDLYARALRNALHDHRELTPAQAERVSYVPHGLPVTTEFGETIFQLQQSWGGIPILDAVRSVRLREDGSARVTAAPLAVPPHGPPLPACAVQEAAYVAALHAAEAMGLDVSNRRPVVTSAFIQPDHPTTLRKVGFRDPITARLRLQVDEGGRLRLVWEVDLEPADGIGRCTVLVTADRPDPAVVAARSLASHAWAALVHDVSPPTAAAQRVDLPRLRNAYPPVGGPTLPGGAWVERDATRGNNVRVLDDDGRPFSGTPQADGTLLFQAAPGAVADQGRCTAFYLCNYLHDFFYLLGFDEARLNFQEKNVTGHGRDRDAVHVWVYDTPDGNRLGFFLNRLDGREPDLVLRPRADDPTRHAAQDPDVVIHEYVHGVTDRMVGRGAKVAPFSKPQSVALAEGFSDYFALTLQNYLRRARGEAERWVFGEWIGMAPTGLRAAAYGPTFTATYGSLRTPGYGSAHDAGQVWCQTLLDMNAALGAGNADLGDERGWQVVVDSLWKLHNGSEGPHFLHARDAIYDALTDRAATWAGDPDALRLDVETVFAARGMGTGARSGSAGYDQIHEAF